jgi:hypothetical protein
MQRLTQAVAGLEQAVRAAPGADAAGAERSGRHDSWRYAVRERLLDVADALAEESAGADDGWLSAREDHLRRERRRLLTRVSLLAPMIAAEPDPAQVKVTVGRFVGDLHHHLRRMHDLIYDAAGMEVGGSE